MEIVNIEARTFEAMMSRFDALEKKMNSLHSEQDKGLKKLLDNQDVCLILNILEKDSSNIQGQWNVSIQSNQP